MDPELLKEAIEDRISKTGQKPKAIMVVHLYGMPAQMDEIMAIGRQYEIPVIEDAAEALGSEYKGRKCGSIGDFGILSFNGNKIITTSGGGALLSNNEEWINKARFLATQAREPAPHYEHKEIGYNYRMSNICAGIGLGQMTVIDQRVDARRSNFETYRKTLSSLPGISLLDEPTSLKSNRWLTAILVNASQPGIPDREKIRLELEKIENIESRPLWKPMHLQPVFRDYPYFGKGFSQNLFENGLCLPSGSNLGNTEQELVVSVIRELVT
jgi:dTDP-4-amino-4,6-dideoxygalactose transaminase